jgi:predicted ATPase
MRPAHIVVVTGASGVGKTTLVRALEARRLVGVRCYYFDSVGVPTAEAMTAQFGSGASWQEAMTRRWIDQFIRNEHGARVAVLDGQVRISMVRSVLAARGVEACIILVDCSHAVREARLRTERRQPELASRDMAAWAAYLRGQADVLNLPVLDTSTQSVGAATDALAQLVSAVG